MRVGVSREFHLADADSKKRNPFVYGMFKDGYLYGLNERKNKEEMETLCFRITGKLPWLWCPFTGKAVFLQRGFEIVEMRLRHTAIIVPALSGFFGDIV
jgi:hypothetical protein